MQYSLSITIEDFIEECNHVFPNRESMAKLLETYMRNPRFIEAMKDSYREIGKRIYIDKKNGWCLAPYPYTSPQIRRPHDHGGSWEVYGQAKGTTLMVDAELVSLPTSTSRALCKPISFQTLEAGHALIANEDTLHAPWRPDDGMIVRIEGKSFQDMRRIAYDWE